MGLVLGRHRTHALELGPPGPAPRLTRPRAVGWGGSVGAEKNKSSNVGMVKFQNLVSGTDCPSTPALRNMVRTSLATHFIFNLCSNPNGHTFNLRELMIMLM